MPFDDCKKEPGGGHGGGDPGHTDLPEIAQVVVAAMVGICETLDKCPNCVAALSAQRLLGIWLWRMNFTDDDGRVTPDGDVMLSIFTTGIRTEAMRACRRDKEADE